MNAIILTIAASLLAFLLPQWYYSFSMIKPNDETGLNIFSAVLGSKGLSGIGKNLNIGGLQYSDLDYYKTVLSSRKITLEMIQQFDLKKVYKQKFNFKAIEDLLANSDFGIDSKSNTLTVGVYDTDPPRAKKMVETYLSLLNSFLLEMKDNAKKFESTLITDRYVKNRADIKIAEDNLKQFQEKYGAILPEEQFKSTIGAIASIEAQKLLLDVEIQKTKMSVGEASPIIPGLNEEKKILDNKISEINRNFDPSADKNIYLSVIQAPALMNQYVALYRELEIQNKLLEFIFPLYEQTMMDANKHLPAFTVIDEAFVPEYKVKPKRALIIVSGLLLSIVLSVIVSFTAEYFRKLKKADR
jgi:tyrosine-protein kinase Etk/Wzc